MKNIKNVLETSKIKAEMFNREKTIKRMLVYEPQEATVGV